MKARKRMAIFLILTSIWAAALMWIAWVMETRAEEREGWIDYIEIICQDKHICPELVESIIEAESSWNPKAQNGDCIGLMQVSRSWHKDRMARLGVTDLTDPYDNILVGVDYLSELFERYEDVGAVLMKYNGDSRLPEYLKTGEMSEYAEKILTRSAELERMHGK